MSYLIALLILGFIFYKIGGGPEFIVVRSCPDEGFEIRQNNTRMWVEVTDKDKYNTYLSKKLNRSLRPRM